MQGVVDELCARDLARETAVRDQGAADYDRWFRGRVSSVSDPFKEVLATAEGQVKLMNVMLAIGRGMAAQGTQPDNDKLFDWALRTEFGDIHDKAIERNVTDKTRAQLTRREKQMTARPTQREAGEPSNPLVAAHEKAKQIYADAGVADPDADMTLGEVPDGL